jgi:uncharacterized protein
VNQLSFVTLGTLDIEAEIAFCAKGLGFGEPIRHSPQLVYWKQDRLHLALHPLENLAEDAGAEKVNSFVGGFAGSTVSINVSSEALVDQAMATALEQGGKLQRLAEKAHWGGYRGYVKSPSGHFWEICYNPFLKKM